MRITYRTEDNFDYWTKRWDAIPADKASVDENSYPAKYAIEMVGKNRGRILEAGCGAGRILRYFHDRAYDIEGIDFIESAVKKLKTEDPSLKVSVGDIKRLSFSDNEFDFVLAFGLYHNLDNDLDLAIRETCRVLKDGGRLCASFRADNFQTRMSDRLAARRSSVDRSKPQKQLFHKLNLTRKELKEVFEVNGVNVESVRPVVNMPIFYKFRMFRSKVQKDFDEHSGRVNGYQLSVLGNTLQKICMRFVPNQFCNIYLLTGRFYDKTRP